MGSRKLYPSLQVHLDKQGLPNWYSIYGVFLEGLHKSLHRLYPHYPWVNQEPCKNASCYVGVPHTQ